MNAVSSTATEPAAVANVQLYSVVFDCADAPALARFWAGALGWHVRRTDPDWSTIGDPSRPGVYMGFGPVPEPKRGKNRIHVDLLVDEGGSRATERARLEGLGARLITTVVEDGVEAHDVMADPEGNEFCLLEPFPDYFS